MWFSNPTMSLVLSFVLFSLLQTPSFAEKKSYIVYMGSHSHGSDALESQLNAVADSHNQFLASFVGGEEIAKDSIFYSYKRHINGFAAVLDEQEAAEIAKDPKVISVFENKGRRLLTTHSWDFMKLEKEGVVRHSSLWKRANYGEDVIIATLDTGVWPESESFNDDGFGPVPSRWKGICQNNTKQGVPCNKKLIGARYFNKGYQAYAKLPQYMNTARDYEGHGSHTLSTAGGSFVAGANVNGVGNGTAKGGSPRARVAAYKICWPQVVTGECFDADILEAIDFAIQDGVDILSVSVGGEAGDYFQDGISIGAFHAVKNGITFVASAGNSGPALGTVSNVSPWMLTVGASTLDRVFEAYVDLKNGLRFEGKSLTGALPVHKFYPLISGALAKAANATEEDALLCKEGTLDRSKAKGKIVVCLRGDIGRVEKGLYAFQAGAAGMILCNDELTGNELIADPHFLPAAHINYTAGVQLFSYINSTSEPMAYLEQSVGRVHTQPAPFMAAFSSRGPNTVTPEILKPDVTAPGVDIIAAYTGAKSPTEQPFDKRRTAFITMSGTSMSCPHVSGVVGLLKALYPQWSPSAIKSAIMTTSVTRDNTGHAMQDESQGKATPFHHGAGHIRPNRAADPGLVYDLTTEDYINFLCASGYNDSVIEIFTDAAFLCPKNVSLLDFNYPSITVPNLSGKVTVTRKVKNVGSPGVYEARVRGPSGIAVSVEPKVLKFEKEGEEKSFQVTLEVKNAALAKNYAFGRLIWSDGTHQVRSPIVVSTSPPLPRH